MARPRKQGLEWFPMDVNWCDDERIGMIEAEFGIKGFAVLMKLFMKIYRDEGYFLRWDERVATLFADRQCRMGCAAVREIVKACVREGIFDAKMFKDYGILTSAEIQDTFFTAAQKRTGLEIVQKYLLVSAPKFVSASETDVSTGKTGIFASETPQRERDSYRDSNIPNTKDLSSNYISSNPYGGGGKTPSYSDIISYAAEKGFDEKMVEVYYDFMIRQSWRDRNGKPIIVWRKHFVSWMETMKKNAADELSEREKEEALYEQLRQNYLAEIAQ